MSVPLVERLKQLGSETARYAQLSFAAVSVKSDRINPDIESSTPMPSYIFVPTGSSLERSDRPSRSRLWWNSERNKSLCCVSHTFPWYPRDLLATAYWDVDKTIYCTRAHNRHSKRDLGAKQVGNHNTNILSHDLFLWIRVTSSTIRSTRSSNPFNQIQSQPKKKDPTLPLKAQALPSGLERLVIACRQGA